jgi:hypothetical protein
LARASISLACRIRPPLEDRADNVDLCGVGPRGPAICPQGRAGRPALRWPHVSTAPELQPNDGTNVSIHSKGPPSGRAGTRARGTKRRHLSCWLVWSSKVRLGVSSGG